MTYDPVPDLAGLIDGVQAVAGAESNLLTVLVNLLTGPYAALRGGLLLDEPGREHLTTEEAIRSALADVEWEEALAKARQVLQDRQLPDHLAECMGGAPHSEHQFNGGMYCPGLPEPDSLNTEKEL